MELFHVPHTHIDKAWRDGAHMLAEACKRAEREITADQLKMILSRNERQLLCAMDGGKPLGWAVVSVSQLPNVRALYVYSIYAPGATGVEVFEQLKGYARHLGCSVIRGACDEVIERLWRRRFAAKRLYSIVELEVGDA